MTLPPSMSEMRPAWIADPHMLESREYLYGAFGSFSPIDGPVTGILSLVFSLQLVGHMIFIAVNLKSPGLVLTNPSPLGPHRSLPAHKHAAESDAKDIPGLPWVSAGSSPSS